jgi:hypothetical protein
MVFSERPFSTRRLFTNARMCASKIFVLDCRSR